MTEPADNGRRRWVAPAVVVAVLALAGLAATLLPRLGDDPSPGVPAARSLSPKPMHVALPKPRTIVRDGTVYTVGLVAPMGAERVAVAADEVKVFTDEEYNAKQPYCNAIPPSARVVHQDADSITIATIAYVRRPNCTALHARTPRRRRRLCRSTTPRSLCIWPIRSGIAD